MNHSIVFAPIHNLVGIGEKTAQKLIILLSRLLEREPIKIIDILHNIPRYYIDRSVINLVAFAPIDVICTFKLTIIKLYHRPYKSLSVLCQDNSGEISLQYFGQTPKWLIQQFYPGKKIIVSGKTSFYNHKLSMLHPAYVLDINQQHLLPKIEPVYSLAKAITNKMYQKYVQQTLDLLPEFPEWIDSAILDKFDFPNYKMAISELHFPSKLELNTIRQRLAYDELLAHQWGLKLIKQPKEKISALTLDKTIITKMQSLLPFTLTDEQLKALAAINVHLQKEEPMHCLLQGDVGCGKTIVIVFAMAQLAAKGYQCVLMAPTEVLARQHYHKLKSIFEELNININILTSQEKGRKKTKVLTDLKNGTIKILIGTHALLYPNIEFANLVFTVIDEQHRFGVEQRVMLLNKSKIPHLLVMTATPIPRTLLLTEFGETEIIQIKEKPKERKAIKTKSLSVLNIDKLIDRIKVVIKDGAKIYWVCPLIEENDNNELMDINSRYKYLESLFPNKVGIIHGKQTAKEKDVALEAFSKGNTNILLATTVIEVGIDIKDANIIIIEHAERFGLAQLHQLRGRVGRGTQHSSCVLLYKEPLSSIAKQRLEIMVQSEDGFYIAEQDLLLRGEGEIFGTRQSGAMNFIFAKLPQDRPLLDLAKNAEVKDINLLKIYSNMVDFAKFRG